MKVNVEGKTYVGEEISREVKSELLAEKHVHARDLEFTAIPYWHRHEIVKFKLASGEIMTYHEILHDDKLHERFIDHEYYMTTEEYRKERDIFMNS